MSRSNKHTPVYKCRGCGGSIKYWKRIANKKVRKINHSLPKSNNYRKVFESWDIHDYRSYCKQADGEDDKLWRQLFYKK